MRTTLLKHQPRTVLGYRKDGRPILPIAGGAPDGDDPGDGGDNGGAGGQEPPADDPKPPWGSPEEFDPEKAWNLIQKLREQKNDPAAAKELTELRQKVKTFEDAGKSESQRAQEALTAAEKRAEEAERRALVLEVAHDKGLTPAQAKRLVGTTKEELEADADELLDTFKGSDGGEKPPTKRPTQRLRGGGDPTEEPTELDPKKLADMVPRRF